MREQREYRTICFTKQFTMYIFILWLHSPYDIKIGINKKSYFRKTSVNRKKEKQKNESLNTII